MRTLYKFSVLLMVASILALTLSVTSLATCSASATDKEVYIDENVKVVFTVKGSDIIYCADAMFSYDSSKLTYVSLSTSLGDNAFPNLVGENIQLSDYKGNATSSTYTVTISFKAKAVGTAYVKLTSSDFATLNAKNEDVPLGTATCSATVTVKAKPSMKLSSDCNLKSLTGPAGCTLSPAFSANTTSYKCTVPYSVEKFPMDWTLSDSKAKATPSGSVTLKVGTNTRSVKITAEDGTTKTYTVTITRLAKDGDDATPTPTTAPTEIPRVTVNINGEEYKVLSTFEDMPEGFEAENYMLNDYEIQTAVLCEVRLVALEDSNGNTRIFRFDELTKKFSSYMYIKNSARSYTMLAELPSGITLEETELEIDGEAYPAWKSPYYEGYKIIYVINQSTGEKYLATLLEDDLSVQRIVSFKTDEVETVASADTVSNSSNENETEFLDTTRKLLIAGIMLVIVLLVILLAVNSSHNKPQHEKRNWGLDKKQEENDGRRRPSKHSFFEPQEEDEPLKDEYVTDLEKAEEKKEEARMPSTHSFFEKDENNTQAHAGDDFDDFN